MKVIYDDITMNRALIRIAHEIIERNKGVENVVLLGIKTRGVYLAERLQQLLYKFEEVKVPTASLDITTYRDDVVKVNREINNQVVFSIKDKKVILVDDVIYHGRTIRAALDAITDLGRPSEVQLVAMIDRGHRELPIRPDYVGKNVPTSTSEVVKVRLKELDGEDKIVIFSNNRG